VKYVLNSISIPILYIILGKHVLFPVSISHYWSAQAIIAVW